MIDRKKLERCTCEPEILSVVRELPDGNSCGLEVRVSSGEFGLGELPTWAEKHREKLAQTLATKFRGRAIVLSDTRHPWAATLATLADELAHECRKIWLDVTECGNCNGAGTLYYACGGEPCSVCVGTGWVDL